MESLTKSSGFHCSQSELSDQPAKKAWMNAPAVAMTPMLLEGTKRLGIKLKNLYVRITFIY